MRCDRGGENTKTIERAGEGKEEENGSDDDDDDAWGARAGGHIKGPRDTSACGGLHACLNLCGEMEGTVVSFEASQSGRGGSCYCLCRCRCAPFWNNNQLGHDSRATSPLLPHTTPHLDRLAKPQEKSRRTATTTTAAASDWADDWEAYVILVSRGSF